jgi:hypothetical protein
MISNGNKPSGLALALRNKTLATSSSATTSDSNSSNADAQLASSPLPSVLPRGTGQKLVGYVHTTAPENLESIAKLGLIANYKEGIGAPSDGSGTLEHGVYVIIPGETYNGDERAGEVAVVSTRAPEPDMNYHVGEGAGVFHSNVLPLRQALTDGGGGINNPYSFTQQMSPATQAGAGRLYRAIYGGNDTDKNAANALSALVTTGFYGRRFVDDAFEPSLSDASSDDAEPLNQSAAVAHTSAIAIPRHPVTFQSASSSSPSSLPIRTGNSATQPTRSSQTTTSVQPQLSAFSDAYSAAAASPKPSKKKASRCIIC